MGEQPAFVIEGFGCCADAVRVMTEYRHSQEREEDKRALLAALQGRR